MSYSPDSTDIADTREPYNPRFGTFVVPFPAHWKRISNVLSFTDALNILITSLSTPLASFSILNSFNNRFPYNELLLGKNFI